MLVLAIPAYGYKMSPIYDIPKYGAYPMSFADPVLSGYSNIYNDYLMANQPLEPYQGIDNIGVEPNNQNEYYQAEMPYERVGKDVSSDWNPIKLAKLNPKLYLSSSGTYSDQPFKCSPVQLTNNSDKLTGEKVDDYMNSDPFLLKNLMGMRSSKVPKLNKDMVKKLFKIMSGSKHNKSKSKLNVSSILDQSKNSHSGNGCFGVNVAKWLDDADQSNASSEIVENISPLNLNTTEETDQIHLPEILVNKKSAQLRALQNLSKLKAMVHIAKGDRRAVEHKREEARRQFLSEVAEELQLISSAKVAEFEASKSYGALLAAQKALSDKDRDIHSLMEKEDTLYEDLTNAEASLAKADMDFIPKLKSENELRQFASFLNFGF